MPEQPKQPKPAQVEDYDSEESAIKPETCRKATSGAQSIRPPSAATRTRRRETTSGSGRPSHDVAATTRTPSVHKQAASPVQSASRQVPTEAARNKPVIHRSESQRSNDKARATSTHDPRRGEECTDPNCADVRCPVYRARYAAWVAQYYPQGVPESTARPRPRSLSQSRQTRPVSMNIPTTSQRGPPPSMSAYQNQHAPYYQSYPRPQSLYGSTPPNQVTLSYPPPLPSPVTTSPTSPSYARQPSYSARQIDPDLSRYDYSKPTTQPGLSRTMSARQTAMPASYWDSESTESDSDSDISDAEIERQRQYWAARVMETRRESAKPSRRPSLNRSYNTAPAVAPPSRREVPRRLGPRSDADLENTSSDYVDSDRTQRTVVDRRTNSAYSSRSRRPSISTTASSGRRTQATTNTSYSGSDANKVIVEDRYGRRTAYLSKEAQSELMRQNDHQRLNDERLQKDVTAYQEATSGGPRPELTAENIRKAQRRTSGSQVSGGRKTSRSGSKTSKPDGIKIQSGDTVLHVYGDAKIEMRPGEDGTPAHFIIDSTSGKDSAYYSGSKSSDSRMPRSRGGSDFAVRRQTIREEDAVP